MLVGNPYVDPGTNLMTRFSALYSHGLVAKPLYDIFTNVCTGDDAYNPNKACAKIMVEIYDYMTLGINPYALDYPICTPELQHTTSTKKWERMHSPSSQVFHFLNQSQTGPSYLPARDDYRPCAETAFTTFMNRKDVQEALHVKSGIVWGACTDDVKYSKKDYSSPVIDLYRDLIHDGIEGLHDLNILVMSGDDDAVCALEGTQDWIFDIGVDPKKGSLWKPWYAKKEVAGYLTKFELGERTNATFTLATVHGSGHEVPAYRPMEGLKLFKKFLDSEW
jgi:hypothetical protein